MLTMLIEWLNANNVNWMHAQTKYRENTNTTSNMCVNDDDKLLNWTDLNWINCTRQSFSQ
jgi:hypothetical protein